MEQSPQQSRYPQLALPPTLLSGRPTKLDLAFITAVAKHSAAFAADGDVGLPEVFRVPPAPQRTYLCSCDFLLLIILFQNQEVFLLSFTTLGRRNHPAWHPAPAGPRVPSIVAILDGNLAARTLAANLAP